MIIFKSSKSLIMRKRLFLNFIYIFFKYIFHYLKKKKERRKHNPFSNFVIYPHGRKLHASKTRNFINPPSIFHHLIELPRILCFHSSTIPITPLYPQRVDFLAIIKLPDLKLPLPIKPTLAIHRFRNLSKERLWET